MCYGASAGWSACSEPSGTKLMLCTTVRQCLQQEFLLSFLLPSLMYTMHDVLLSANDRQLSLRPINNTDSPPGAGCKAQSSTSAHEGQPARGTAAQSC